MLHDILDGLKWLGIHWDEGPDIGGPYPPYKQTQKVDHYSHVANQLIAKGAAYLAYETPEELAALKEEQKAKGEPPRYDNRGTELNQSQIEHYLKEGRVPSIRFKLRSRALSPGMIIFAAQWLLRQLIWAAIW